MHRHSSSHVRFTKVRKLEGSAELKLAKISYHLTSKYYLLFYRYEDIVADVLSDDESPSHFRTAADYKQKKSAALSGRPKALYTVGETRKIVQDEKEAGRRKMGVCR